MLTSSCYKYLQTKKLGQVILFVTLAVCDFLPVLLRLFKNVTVYVSDSLEAVHFWRIRYGCDNMFGESE